MKAQFYAARVPMEEIDDFLVILVYPQQVSTVEEAVRLYAELRETLGEVRYVLRSLLPDGEERLYGPSWLIREVKRIGPEGLDWRPLPVDWK